MVLMVMANINQENGVIVQAIAQRVRQWVGIQTASVAPEMLRQWGGINATSI